MQDMSTTDGIAIHHSNHRFWQTTDLHLNVKNRQTRYTLLIYIATSSFNMHVTSRTESMLYILQPLAFGHLAHRTCQNHYPYIAVLAANRESLREFQRRQRGERVAVACPVDGNLCNVIILFKEYLLERVRRFPFSLLHIPKTIINATKIRRSENKSKLNKIFSYSFFGS